MRRRHVLGRIAPPAFTAALTLILTSGAAAQNALGDGATLDANPAQGYGGRNMATPEQNFRLRNLLVTGDVAGGRGFRGSVGYAAEYDFRGELGSNELFPFRAYSAFSDPQWINNWRGYDPLSAGQAFGLYEVDRPGRTTSLDYVQSRAAFPYGQVASWQAQFDRLLASQAEVSSTFTEEQPLLVSEFYSADREPFRVTASPLRGLVREALTEDPTAFGLTPYDALRLREDLMAERVAGPLIKPFEYDYERLLGPEAEDAEEPFEPVGAERVGGEAVDGAAIDPRLGEPVPSAYDQIMRRIMARYESIDPREDVEGVGEALDDGPLTPADLQTELEAIQRYLQGQQPVTPTTEPGEEPGEEPGDEPGDAPATEPEPGEVMPGGEFEMPEIPGLERPETPEPPSGLEAPEVGEMILKHGSYVGSLSTGDGSRYAELVDEGQMLINRGDYFSAEARFLRALRLQPYEPLAMAGMANSQIGAGLYQAAAATLRDLFTRHPAMIDTVYSPELLPNRRRLEVLTARLAEPVEEEGFRSPTAEGLVLAYLGHQTGDRSLIEAGLRKMRQADAHDPLPALLRPIWLAEDSNAPAPAETGANSDENAEK